MTDERIPELQMYVQNNSKEITELGKKIDKLMELHKSFLEEKDD